MIEYDEHYTKDANKGSELEGGEEDTEDDVSVRPRRVRVAFHQAENGAKAFLQSRTTVG